MSGKPVEWGFYDRDADIVESARFLPHKDQAFVTFRLADSMPRDVVTIWQNEIEDWLKQNCLGGFSVEQVLESSKASPSLMREFRKFKNRRWHRHLDDCHGSCLLRNPECRFEVSESILHFNAQRYDVERFVVMPNHVHVLIQMRDGFELRKQFREIQRFSAREINKLLGRSGDLWQGEPFDHVVRNERQFAYLQHDIFDNPKKAHLSESEFTYWQCE